MTARARMIWIRVAIAVAVVVGGLWWMRVRGQAASHPDGGRGRGSQMAGSGANARPVPVQLAAAERKDLPVWLEGLGTIAAFQQVTVRTQVDGRLDQVLFTEGQTVQQGDVLAQIDPRPFMVQLHQAQGALARDRAQRDALKRDYDRDVELRKQNLLAQVTVDDLAGQIGQAEGAMRIDASQIENAQLQLDYARVKAPFAGITGVRQIDAGNVVHATDPNGLVVISAIDPAAIFFTIPQDRLPQVAAAQARGDVPVEVWNRDGTQQLGMGKLAVLDNQINQTTATLRLKALVPNPARLLWPNAFVKARMLVETRKNALLVPTVAVQYGPQGAFVYVVGGDGTAALKPVVVGIISGEHAVIDKGIEAGDQVVIEGQNQLRPGTKVVPIKPGAGSNAGRRDGAGNDKLRGSAAEPTGSNRSAAPP